MLNDPIDEFTTDSTINTGEPPTLNNINRPPFIANEQYELLKIYQHQIFELTEFTPNIRKLVNGLITIENLDKLKAILVKSLT